MRRKLLFVWFFILSTTACHLLYAEDVHKTYYANGSIKSEVIIISPKEAIIRIYFNNGNLQSESHMWHDEDIFVDSMSLFDINKLKKVALKVFYENGQLISKSVMAKGKTLSAVYFDEDGNTVLELDEKMKVLMNDKDKMKQLIESVLNEEESVSVDTEKISRLINNDTLARGNLIMISSATEAYAKFNNGQYPEKINDLILAKPPYIKRELCNEKIEGYQYKCEFSKQGYKFKAVPLEVGVTGSTVHTIETGGNIHPEKIKSAFDYLKEEY